MPRFEDIHGFLDYMVEAEDLARVGWANGAQDYESHSVPSGTVPVEPAAGRFLLLKRLMWCEEILARAFDGFYRPHVQAWWLRRAMRLSTRQAANHPKSPYKQANYVKLAKRFDELDQLLLDELARRGLLTYLKTVPPTGEEDVGP